MKRLALLLNPAAGARSPLPGEQAGALEPQ